MNFDDPRQVGMLQFGLGLLSAAGPRPYKQTFGGGLAEAGQQGLRSYAMQKEMQAREQERAQAKLLFDLKMKQMQQAQEEELAGKQATQDYLARLGQVDYPAGSTIMTDQGRQMMSQAKPKQFDPLEAYRSGVPLGNVSALQGLMPKPKSPLVTKPGDILRDPDNPTSVIAKNEVEEKFDPNKPFYVKDGQIVANPMYQKYAQELADRQATRITNAPQFNTGEKGFKYSVDLADKFRQEPVYKAHQEVTNAYGQIKAALEQPSGASDLAAATKFMKLLDPGSVVRESELVMAMSTSGLLDRMANYANMVISGQKLTPTQRKQFREMTDKLFEESRNLYNQKRNQYKAIADKYELDAEIIPAESNPRVSVGDKVDWKRASDAEILKALGINPLPGQ